MSGKIYEVNVANNEVIERDFTDEEIAQELADRDRLAQLKADKEAAFAEAKSAKIALLEKLGITEAEAKLLLS